MPRPTSAPPSPRSPTTSRRTASPWRSCNAAAMGLDDELEREAAAAPVAHRPRRSPSAAPRRRGPAARRCRGRGVRRARCSRRSRRGRTTAPGAPTSRASSREALDAAPLGARARARCGSCASSCRRPTSTRRSRSTAMCSGCRRPRRTRPRAARAWRSSTPDARRWSSPTRRRSSFIDRGRDRRRRERPHPRRARGATTRRRRSSASPAAGAAVEASARETPWRSLNARLRGPADLQLTLFQELGPA